MTTFTDQGSSVDTFMSSAEATTNYGTTAVFAAGNDGVRSQRTLIKWDLSSIPGNAIVSSATLSIFVAVDASNNARTLRAYRVLRAWTEDGATWNKYDGSSDWGTAGCANTSTDREATDIGTASIDASPPVGTEYQISLTASKVQEWISGALTNNGLLLQADTENADSIQYDSAESLTALEKPKLVITYELGAFLDLTSKSW